MWKTQKSKWKKLDNAAKIFPAMAGKNDSEVFRLSCQLKEQISHNALQRAVDAAIEEYPLFTQTIRRGVFWYYLESTGYTPKVHEENKTPLQPLYSEGSRLLIDISYFKKRINLEVFHALTDGTGAFVFFTAIITNYLCEIYADELEGIEIESPDSTAREKESDGFTQYFEADKGSSTNFEFLGDKDKKNKVYHFNEQHTPDYRQLTTEGLLSAQKIVAAAKNEGATVTEFLCAQLILAIYETMEPKDRKKSIAVAIPVNLRNYFKSETIRNFFGIIQVNYDFSKGDDHTLSKIIESVHKSFKRELTYDNMKQKIASQVKMERHPIVRMCPLIIKDIVVTTLQTISMKRRTITLSNVGKIHIQPELKKYIELFDVFNSSSSRQVCLCTFEDNMVISFSGVLAEHDVERAFFRNLAKYDEDITVSANYSPKDFDSSKYDV